ncbi:MAG: EF-hand domain-containing protein [Planctomycetes bacterium]|nr:EF-hand domain-containing protein [Planctomycetota bacterium]
MRYGSYLGFGRAAAVVAALLAGGAAPARADDAPAAGKGAGKRPLTVESVMAMDADGDGMIARAEWTGKPKGFDATDADRDGKLSREEVAAAVSLMNGGGGGGGNAPAGESGKPAAEGKEGKDGKGARRGPLAQPSAGTVRLFDDYDTNKDGRLSYGEFRSAAFDRMDSDGDGRVVAEELPVPMVERVMKIDADGDGAITRAEFGRVPDPFMKRHDGDGNGWIDRNEFLSFLDGAAGGGPGGMDGKNGGLAATGEPDKDAEAFIQKFDKNGDKKVSKAEFTAAPNLFDRIDRDQDGQLTQDEVGNFYKQLQKRAVVTGPPDFIERYDKNKDGRVTPDEYDGPEEGFARVDLDGDGAITARDAGR